MPSADALTAAIRTALDRTRRLLAGIGASSEFAAESHDQISALGFQRRADQLGTAVNRLDECRAQALAIAELLEAALAAAETARAGGGGGKPPGSPPLTAPPPAPSDFGSTGYPGGKAHRISWSDLHHVVNGDADNPEKGGHASGTGRPGKTEFPAGWSDEDISAALASAADRPSKVNPDLTGRNFIAEGTHRGVTVQAVVRPDGSIEAGWPVRGPGVKRNPRRR